MVLALTPIVQAVVVQFTSTSDAVKLKTIQLSIR